MLYAFKCLFYVALTILLVVAIDFINCCKQETRKILPMLEVQSNLLREDTCQLVSREFAAIRSLLASELENTREDLRNATLLLDSRLASIQGDISSHLLVTEDNLLHRVDALHLRADTILSPLADVMEELAEAAPMFLDCEFNPNCFFNRWVGMGQGIERASYATADMAEAARDFMEEDFPKFVESGKNMAKSGEDMAESMNQMAADGAKITAKITEPQPWWKKAISYTVSAAYVYKVFDILTGGGNKATIEID